MLGANDGLIRLYFSVVLLQDNIANPNRMDHFIAFSLKMQIRQRSKNSALATDSNHG